MAPGNSAPIIGAGNTLTAKSYHLVVLLSDCACNCSVVLNHVFPTSFLLANRLFPTPVALRAKEFDSAVASADTAAAKTATSGIKKYRANGNSMPKLDCSSNANVGASNDNAEADVATPTLRGNTDFTRSAPAKIPSASAAACIAAAAISLPVETATFPLYSAEIPTAADKAAIAGTSSSTTFPEKRTGDNPDVITVNPNSPNSSVDSCA